jgi:hypothetical protein
MNIVAPLAYIVLAGACLWRVNALPSELLDELPQGKIFVYVAFDKTGSTTFRRILTQRENEHGWPTYEGEPCHISSFNKSDGLRCASVPGIENDKHVTNKSYLNIIFPLFLSDGDVIIEYNRPSYCNETTRPCKYFTVLRDPIDRILSAYSYFCQGCAEGGRQCRGYQDPKHLICPNMTLFEYAEYFGSVYTQGFAPSGAAVAGKYNRVKAAMQFLNTILVITFKDMQAERPFAGLGKLLEEPWLEAHESLASNKHDHVLPQVLDEVRDALRDDIELYQAVLKSKEER